MRKSKFTEQQIAMALRQGEAGTPVADICRKLGIIVAGGDGHVIGDREYTLLLG